MSIPRWVPKRGEDRLLRRYLGKAGGTAYMQVRVGEDEPRGTRRILDAVRIPAKPGETTRWWKFRSSDADEFWSLASAASKIEIIEVKNQLGPWVIGQAYVGKFLLENEIQSKKTKVKPVIVCREGADGLLAEVCADLDIRVWPCKSAGVPGAKTQGKRGSWPAEPVVGGCPHSISLLEVCADLDIRVWTQQVGGSRPVRRRKGKEAVGDLRWSWGLDLIAEGVTRGAIGSLVTAGLLLEKTLFSELKPKKIIEYDKPGNKSVLEVCKKLGIEVRPRRASADRK